MSSGCIRLTNEDVEDLYNRVTVGAKVVVLPTTAIARRAAHVASRPSFEPAARQRVSIRHRIAKLAASDRRGANADRPTLAYGSSRRGCTDRRVIG